MNPSDPRTRGPAVGSVPPFALPAATAAVGKFPYPHRTVAQVDFDARPPCKTCWTRIVNACSYPSCPGRGK